MRQPLIALLAVVCLAAFTHAPSMAGDVDEGLCTLFCKRCATSEEFARCELFNAFLAEPPIELPDPPPPISLEALAAWNNDFLVRQYEVDLREEAKGPPNFAGYLRAVNFGVSGGLTQLILIDLRSGEIVYGGLFADYVDTRQHSTLLITEDTIPLYYGGRDEAAEDGGDVGIAYTAHIPAYYVWDGKTLRHQPYHCTACSGDQKPGYE